MRWPKSVIAWKAQCCWFSSSQVMLPALHFPPLLFIHSSCLILLFLNVLSQARQSLLQPFVSVDRMLSSPWLSLSATEPSKPGPLYHPAPQTPHYPLPRAVSIMKAWFQYFPSFLCSLLCRLMQIPNFNKQLLNMSLTLLRLQMKLCYWDYSGSYSFVMSFVNHSWPAVYRMKLRLSSFFLRLLSFFSQRITILLPERLITCTNKRVWDINTKFTGFSLSQTCNSLYISSW